MTVPFPPRAFPAPVIHPADRGFAIVLDNGTIVDGYLRRNADPTTQQQQQQQQQQQHAEFAYERYQKVIDLGQKGKILYGRKYERLASQVMGRYRATEEFVVIKKLSKSWLQQQQQQQSGGATENPLVEIAVSQMIGNNHNVIQMHEALQDDKYYYMIMPYLGSDLCDAASALLHSSAAAAASNNENENDETPSANDVVPLVLQTLVHNLLYLQQHNIIHRDLSPENIIVHADKLLLLQDDDDEAVVLCCPLIDFAMALRCATLEGNSLSIRLPQSRSRCCGKLPYMSPEVVNGSDVLDFGVDVWALGCTLFLLWTGQRLYEQPFDRCWEFFIANNGIERVGAAALMLHHHHNNDGNAIDDDDDNIDMDMMNLAINTNNLPPGLIVPVMDKSFLVQGLDDLQRDLLSKMLHMDPTKRITAHQILQHGYCLQ